MRRRTLVAWAGAAVLGGALAAVVHAALEGDGYEQVALWTDGFREPSAIAVLPDGSLVVADYSADSVTRLAADGSVQWRVDRGLDHPSGLDVDGRGVWVADAATHRVLLLDAQDGRTLRAFAVDDRYQPTDVAARPDGRLWVSATPQDRVLLLDDAGQTLLDLESAGGGDAFRAPRGLSSDGLGGVFVAEALGGALVHLDPGGTQVGVVGAWGLGAGQFVKPKDLARMPDGGWVVLDSHQGVLQILSEDGTFQRLVAGPEGPIVFDHALGVATSGDRLYVADTGSGGVRVLERGVAALDGGRFPARTALFRTVSIRDEDPSPVCRQCHDGTRRLTAGNWDPAAHNHPRKIDGEGLVPEDFELTADGSLKCTSCHSVHTPEIPHHDPDTIDLGLAEPRSPESVHEPDFCLECHVDYLDASPARHRRSHPVNLPPPKGALVADLEHAGGQIQDGEVTCRACHRPHGAPYEHLLVLPAESGTLCLTCHQDHDRATSLHPVQITVEADIRARVERLGGALDPEGRLTCLSCHDPHAATANTLLRAEGGAAAACRMCHGAQAQPIAKGGHAAVDCARCHGMHNAPDLPHGAVAKGVGPQICLDCHTTPGDAPFFTLDATHPLGVPAENGMIGCETCHVPHGEDARLLPVASTGELCTSCHAEQGSVTRTDHDAATVAVAGSSDGCLSCHDVHGSKAPFLVPAKEGMNPASGRCLRCHDGSTSATDPGPASHPSGLLLTTAGLPFRYEGPVPYFGPDGRPSDNRAAGEITCSTCHDPHRWKHDEFVQPGAADGSEQDSFLRDPDEVASFCSVCHGLDGRPRFRFFHSERFRAEQGGNP